MKQKWEKRQYKKNRVFNHTIVKTKRRLLRSLGTIIETNDVISCSSIKNDTYTLEFFSIDEKKRGIALNKYKKLYTDILSELVSSNKNIKNKAESLLKMIENDIKNSFYSRGNIVYYKPIAQNNLQNYNTIIFEIENMYVYNRKFELKEKLKKLIEMFVINKNDSKENWESLFFLPSKLYERIILLEEHIFSYEVDSIKRKNLSKKVYSQLLNRIQFKKFGLYKKNTDEKNQASLLKPKFISSLDILEFKINYIKQKEWIFKEYFLKELRRYIPNYVNTPDGDIVDLNELQEELESYRKIANMRYEDYSEGNDEYDEYIAPIDYETYIDDTLKEEFRKSANSIQKQWDDKYKEFSKIVQNQDEINPYCNVKNYSKELLFSYKILVENNVFTKAGNINGFSKLIIKRKKEIKEQLLENLLNSDSKALNKEIESILNLQKKEWKFMYQIMRDYNFVYLLERYSEFDTENLRFKLTRNVLQR